MTWNGTRWSSRATLIAGAQNGDQLTDVSCPKVNFCMGIGATAGYAALAERWNGSRWIAEKTPKPAAQLTAVSCPSPTSCTAIGLYVTNQTGRTLAEHWNGRRWTIQPTASRIFSGSFPSMSCASARSCVAVADGTKRMFAEVWNGTRWTYRVIHPPAGALAAGVGGVSCSSPDACTAVGYYSNGRGIAVPLAERWNGKSWRTMLPAVPGSDSGLEVVSCASARSCVATGSRFVQAGEQSFAEVWTGGKWFVHELRPPEDPDYFPHASVSCARSTAVSCMAVGHSELPSMYMWAEHYS